MARRGQVESGGAGAGLHCRRFHHLHPHLLLFEKVRKSDEDVLIVLFVMSVFNVKKNLGYIRGSLIVLQF